MVEEAVPAHIAAAAGEQVAASEDKLEKAKKLALEYATLELQIETLESQIEKKKVRKLELQRKEIPEFFDGNEIGDIGLPGAVSEKAKFGVNVTVAPYYHANIQKDWDDGRKKKAFDYLESKGDGDVVSVVVSVKFSRGEIAEARELEQYLKAHPKFGNTHPPVLDMGVPWNTLTSLVKEMVENGEQVDLEVLGATVGRTAKIVKRKK